MQLNNSDVFKMKVGLTQDLVDSSTSSQQARLAMLMTDTLFESRRHNLRIIAFVIQEIYTVTLSH